MLRNVLLFAFCLAATAAFFTFQGKASFLQAREKQCLSTLSLKNVPANSAKAVCGCLVSGLDERVPLHVLSGAAPCRMGVSRIDRKPLCGHRADVRGGLIPFPDFRQSSFLRRTPMRRLALVAFAFLSFAAPTMAATIQCAGKSDGALSLLDPGTNYDLVFTINPGGASAILHKPQHQANRSVPIDVTDSDISFQYEDYNYVLGIANNQRLSFNFSVDRYTGTGFAKANYGNVAIRFVCSILEEKAF